MSYVAEPYDQFADDLLTALTGGVAREEHRFERPELRYALAVPDAVASTIRVFGQRAQAFSLFEAGIDYRYDAGETAIQWEADLARQPDDRSYFYVNYYRAEGPRRLTDRNPGSVTATLAGAFGRELAVIGQQMGAIYRSGFVDSATGGALDHLAALLSLERRDARFAGGEALFGRSTPATGDINIPAGTVVSTERGESFDTTADRTLRRGQLSVAAPIRARAEGGAGRVDAGAIRIVNRPLFGIETVTNAAATFFAAEKETDEEFRRRIKAALERAGRATLDGLRYGLIETVPGVTEGNIQVVERADQAGVVEVRLGLESGDDADLVRRVEEAILASRPAGVRVTHNLPTRTAGGAQNGKGGPHGLAPIEHLLADVLERSPDLLPLRAEVLLRLAEPNLTAVQKEGIESDARDRVVAYIEALPMGADLSHAKLLGRVVDDARIVDARLRIGAADPFTPLYETNLATDGRKARAATPDVSVGLMDERVRIDLRLELERLQQPRDGVQPDGERPDPRAIQSALDPLVRARIAGARGALAREQLRAELATSLAALQPPMQFRQGASLVLNAEYTETGRLVSNADTVALEEQQMAELGQLTVDVPGPGNV
jgi:baseplate J-like protein